MKHQVADALLALAATTLDPEEPRTLGSVLSQVASRSSFDLLEDWASTDDGAQILQRLAGAVEADRSILALCPPWPVEIPARLHFRGALAFRYLAAMTAEQFPPVTPEERRWLATLRLWVLVHGIREAFKGNLVDYYLREVANKIRLACDADRDWRNLIIDLRTSVEDLELLDSRIAMRARLAREALRPDQPGASTRRSFLTALERVARNEAAPVTLPQVGTQGLPALQGSLRRPSTIAIPPRSLVDDEEARGASEQFDSEDEDDDLGSISTDYLPSYTHHRLRTRSVLLARAQTLAHLPWAWEHLNRFEQVELDHWISAALDSADPCLSLLGALTWIAVHTGRSLRRALDIPIAEEPGAEWTLSPTTWGLHREPPRRSGWSPETADQKRWVTPVAAANHLRLPGGVRQILGSAFEVVGRADDLGGLWTAESAHPEERFRREMTGPLARIRPGMLGYLLGLRAFHASDDAAFSRLVASHPQSGLPGACAYPCWSTAQVEAVLHPDSPTLGAEADAGGAAPIDNALGSLLDPLEGLLQEAVAQAGQRVRAALDQGDLVRCHNLYIGYLSLALLAGTGARPIRDPLESPELIDHSIGFIYLDDKSDGRSHQGRLAPLPSSLGRHLAHRYPVYLGELAQSLAAVAPVLASEVAVLAAGQSSGRLPYLFLLSDEPGLGWSSVSKTRVAALGLFDCPLSAYLFRHRFANRLRDQRVSPEIIDGYMGHAEAGLVSYGDLSPRCWSADRAAVAAAIDDAFDALGFDLEIVPEPARMALTVHSDTGGEQDTLGSAPVRFGAEARERERYSRKRVALRNAQSQIEAFCSGRELTDLSPEEIDRLSRSLLFKPSGLPRPTGFLRYEYLMRKFERAWKRKGNWVRIRRRHFPLANVASPFRPTAPGAPQRLRELQAVVRSFVAQARPSRMGRAQCLGVGVVSLCVENRICDPLLLERLLAGRDFRLVSWRNTPYLEYAPELVVDDPAAPVQRYRIGTRTAVLLDRALASARGVRSADQTAPSEFAQGLGSILGAEQPPQGAAATYRWLIERMRPVVDQANAISLPGILAAFLAGRLPSASLSWRDWLRLDGGGQVDIPDTLGCGREEMSEPALSDLGPALSLTHSTLGPGGESTQIFADARSFFVALRAVFPAPHEYASCEGYNARRDLSRRLAGCVREWSDRVSSTLLLLGSWTSQLVLRKVRDKKSYGYLRLSTALRYLEALSPGFQSLGCEIDLLDADEAEITQFYSDLLQERELRNGAYVRRRLEAFHRWARASGVDEPDWADLPVPTDGLMVSPGVITEPEYHVALRLLLAQPALELGFRLAQAFLLLCAYRFAMRGIDALGLTRADWLEFDGLLVAVVRNRPARKLKTTSSRRQIPLLFALSDSELEIIEHHLAQIDALPGSDDDSPLFPLEYRRNAWRLKGGVIAALKRATGNPQITLHHARHTPANRVAGGLMPMTLPSWWKTLTESDSAAQIAEWLLGTDTNTRRGPWALAVYLGHAGPGTGLRSYLHVIGDWANEVIGIDDCDTPAHSTRIQVLERFPRRQALASGQLETLTRDWEAPTPALVLKLLRLIARGRRAAAAGSALRLDPGFCTALDSSVREIGGKVRLGPRRKSTGGAADYREFLRRVTEDGWRRLLALAENGRLPDDDWKSPIPLTEFSPLVGARDRQIVLWKAEHFALVRAALEFYRIEEDGYQMVHSNAAGAAFLRLAEAERFQPISQREAGAGGRPVQLDSGLDGDVIRNPVAQRCALRIHDGGGREIRNRLEFIVAMLAFVAGVGAAGQSQGIR